MNFVKKGNSILIILNNEGKINLPEVATKNKIVKKTINIIIDL
jgi:hypothetical protein